MDKEMFFVKKHILCFGDSNTHGYCADPEDCSDGSTRFNEDERWTSLLQKALGDAYLVIEEGLSGRTTVFEDPLHEGMSGLSLIGPCMMSHEPIDLLVVMLGTNDTKERLGVNAACIGIGMERLLQKAAATPAWRSRPNILLIAPPHIGEGLYLIPEGMPMGQGCPQKSRELARYYRALAERMGCAFLDAEGVAEFNKIDCMHFTKRGHQQLAERLAKMIPDLA